MRPKRRDLALRSRVSGRRLFGLPDPWPGPLLIVQPCDVKRQPVDCAVLVGPLQDDADVAAVGETLRDCRFDPIWLPAHLRTAQRAVHAAARN
jgi:hypothetical protein